MSRGSPENLVLSVYPTSRGLAYVLFEGPESPYDWGVAEVKGPNKNRQSLHLVAKLVERHHPDVVVIEDTTAKGSRRSTRIRRLYRLIVHLAATERIEIRRYSQHTVRETLAATGAVTKHDIAIAIARQIPAFTHRLPRARRAWMSEDPRQSLFDAAALGLCFFSLRQLESSDPDAPPSVGGRP
jgi:Holliday junction resolvasome RuvABC endonuclease subunit